MIVSCPSCRSRYDVPPARLSARGSLMRCASCGQSWIEAREGDIIDVSARNVPATLGPVYEPDREVSRLAEAAREAQAEFHAQRRRRARKLQAWGAFGLALLAVPAAAALYPEPIVAVAPAAARFYEKAGVTVNIYGLALRKIEQKHTIADGQRVLAVKGEIVNVSDVDRKVPSVRFALRDATGKEVYVWTADSGVRPLRPGEATAFSTRVADPPPVAENLEIRFARKSEIASNPAP